MSENNTTDGAAYRLVIEDPRGFPDTIGSDLERDDGKYSNACKIDYERDLDRVILEARSDNAAKWLYDWLEETREFYRTEFVDASGEHDAAKQLADVLYNRMKQDPT